VTRRSAPRRRVTDIWKTGDYGTSLWHHKLECGHIETRKRRRPAEFIGCVRCEAGDSIRRDVPLPEEDILVNQVASLDTEAAILRAKLAGALRVSPDSVTVQVLGDRVAGALVFLDPSQVAEVINR
jgi:hypothetical protein